MRTQNINNLTGKGVHTLWHHLVMVIVSESINFIWLFTAISVAIAGFAIIYFSRGVFFMAAVGLPVMLAGISVALFKIHEIVLVLARPKRLEAICKFCNDKS